MNIKNIFDERSYKTHVGTYLQFRKLRRELRKFPTITFLNDINSFSTFNSYILMFAFGFGISDTERKHS